MPRRMSAAALCLLLALVLLPWHFAPAFSSPAPSPAPESGDGSTQAACSEYDIQALLDFKGAIKNFNESGWSSSDTNCCSWPGVACSPSSSANIYSFGSTTFGGLLASTSTRVVNLSLPSMGFEGYLSPALGNLTGLKWLNLSNNQFSGLVPATLGSLLGLKVLDLSSNNLSGPVTFLQSMISLNLVNISCNSFRGYLPPLNNLTALEEFSARSNHLVGLIQTDVCNYSSSIRVLDLSENKFTGSLGNGLGTCKGLKVLNLSLNGLDGRIPMDVFNLISLTSLYLAKNNFSGNLSGAVGNLTNLTELSLGYNQLTGSLPGALSKCTKLKSLILNSNNFSGPVSLDFGVLHDLEIVDLNTNNFTGFIPASISSCTALKILNMAKNGLSGEIPRQFNSLKNLTYLSLSSNQLNGSLLALADCINLVSLIVSKNVFTEALAENLTGFSNIQVLALGNLGLTGKIPAWLKNCTKLQLLDLSWNKLEGGLPDWLGSFPHLFYVELSNNSFSGSIPVELYSLPGLIRQDNTTGLQSVVTILAVRRQNGSPDLQYNQVASFPPSLLLSHNILTGSISPEIGNLKMLVVLDLSYNQLTGSIPPSLGNATSLEQVFLSRNNLTGVIPASLSNLTFLAIFDVSYNNLVGQIPSGNQFSTFNNTSFIGNPGLCGAPLSHCGVPTPLPTSMEAVSSRGRSVKWIAIVVPITVGFGLAAFLAAVLFWTLSRRNVVYQGSESSRDMDVPHSLSGALNLSVELFHSHEKLTVGDLFKATNNFDAANIVGCGGFGLVYRADLAGGSKLAIKKLTGDCGQMEREFRAELDALQKAQHKNLVSLQGYFQVGNERLLIYSYMENGSLDYWLHERGDGGTWLDWHTRLKIAQGAAEGLGYLHQICIPHIVHRDIKSSNILLDEKFEAHLADFGLARLMMSTDTHVTTELVGTLGYIPPEYSQAYNATLRGDVYSFGVVMLELLTRKRPVDVCKPRGAGDLVAWVQQLRREGKAEEIFDSLLRHKGYEEQMLQVLSVACLCINPDPFKRPTIKEIVSWLDEVGQENQLLK